MSARVAAAGPKPAFGPAGRGLVRLAVGVALAGAGAGAAHAAPLDALLSADTRGATAPGTATDAPGTPWRIELTGQLADARLDRFGLASASTGARSSSYRGEQLRVRHAGERWLTEAALWRHRIDDRGDPHRFSSWLLAGQWRLNGIAAGDAPATSTDWALRGSAWGSQADRLQRRSTARLAAGDLDARLDSLQLIAPRDRQLQLDLIASRRLPVWGAPVGSAFVGLGRSRVDNRGVLGRATVAGCPYTLNFGPERLQAQPLPGCAGALIIGVPNALLPLDAVRESSYGASLAHLGGSLRWSGDGWSAALGYSVEHWQRDIDAISRARGSTRLTQTRTWVGEWQTALAPQLNALLRAQLSQHQLLGELPAGYNTFTASRYAPRSGLLGVGLQWSY